MLIRGLVLTTTALVASVGTMMQPGLAQTPSPGAIALATQEVSIAQNLQQPEPVLTQPVTIARVQGEPEVQGFAEVPLAIRLEPESPLPSSIPFYTPDQDVYLAPGPVPWGAVGPSIDRGIQAVFRLD